MNFDHRSFLQKSPAEQADYWLALLNSPLVTEQRQRDFQRWLNNPQNKAAWQTAQRFWQQLDSLSIEQVEQLEQRFSAPTQTLGVKITTKQKSTPPRFLMPWLMPTFACLVLAILLNTAFQSGYFADYHTVQGEQQQIQLSDGSSVLLNTSSSLSVNYSAQRRTVTLHGEAYFSVAADANRPFTVETETGEVTALGTAFDVSALNHALTVTVYQHAVRVAFKQGTTIERLQQGEQVAYQHQAVGAVSQVNLKHAKAWQEHRLIFANQPLQTVIGELNRYRSGKIVILDSQLAARRVTGVFDSQDTESALATIEKTLVVKELRLTDWLVVLTPS